VDLALKLGSESTQHHPAVARRATIGGGSGVSSIRVTSVNATHCLQLSLTRPGSDVGLSCEPSDGVSPALLTSTSTLNPRLDAFASSASHRAADRG